MHDLEIAYKVLLGFLAFIAAIGGAAAVIWRWGTPYRNLKADVASLKNELTTLKNYQNTDHKELQKIELGTEKICKCVLAITDHELTGNSVDKLRIAKDEMQDFLIQK